MSGASTCCAIIAAPKAVLTAKGRRKERPTPAEAEERSLGSTTRMRKEDMIGQLIFIVMLRSRYSPAARGRENVNARPTRKSVPDAESAVTVRTMPKRCARSGGGGEGRPGVVRRASPAPTKSGV